ncbi:hypothetical protein C8Q77DRAFT_1059584 [Trametes polyzona]|nr:hypothetical protein C8Q77DRAFT_1059584 [Trametes polyzona]
MPASSKARTTSSIRSLSTADASTRSTRRHTPGTISDRQAGSTLPVAHARVTAAEAGESNDGGLRDEPDEEERAALNTEKGVSSNQESPVFTTAPCPIDHAQQTDGAITHVTHIPAIIAAGPVVDPQTGRKVRFATDHLDPQLRAPFNNRLTPLTRIVMATHTPWYTLSAEERQGLFNRVFPNVQHQITTNDLIYALMGNRVTDWQSKFGSAAMTAVDSKFSNDLMLLTPESRAAYCREALGASSRAVEAMKAPFLWRRWRESDGRKQGRFQGELVLKTLGCAHYPVIQSLPADLRLHNNNEDEPRPCGALILAVLAVERALGVWRTGVKLIPHGSAAYFSADNWADKTAIVHGVAKPQQKVKKLMDRARNLDHSAWQAILTGARAAYLSQKASQEKQAIVVESHSDISSAQSDGDFSAEDE